MQTEAPPATELGNVWIIAASIAMNLMETHPQAIVIDSDGKLVGIPPGNPAFEDALIAPGYVCTIDRSSDVRRIAARIRAAAVAVEPPAE